MEYNAGVIPESFVYGVIIGVALVLVVSWLTGRRLRFQRPTLPNILAAAIGAVVPFATAAVGLGFETGIVLLLAAAAITYAWKRLRPQPS